MSAPVEQIKSRLSITDVIGSYLKLEKAGANWKAPCPFHNEKTPSFFVSPTRQSYHCFGCSRGGDIFSFVQEIEGLDFVGALKVLALRAGVELTPIDRKALSEKERLYEILESATHFYERSLERSEEALRYLEGRGVSRESIKLWRLGFVPPGWRNLHQFLRGEGFSDEVMLKAGLVILPAGRQVRENGNVRDASPYDRFRERIMFPLSDVSGRVVGFSGRVFGPNPPENVGKYINSPETPLYNKSKILYGYDQAKVAIRREDKAILVEGQLDLVLSHQAGLRNTVAVSGTALTEHHLQLIRRLSSNLVMAFDGDLAGFRASKRGIELALELGLEVRVAELSPGKDPADIVLAEPKAWLETVKRGEHVIDFLLGVITRNAPDKRELANLARKEIYPYLVKLRHGLDQAHFVKKLAERVDLTEEVIRRDLATWQPEFQTTKSFTKKEESVPAPRSRQELILRRIFGLAWWQKELVTKLKLILGPETYAHWEIIFLPEQATLILEAELLYQGLNNFEPELESLALEFKHEELREELVLTLKKIKEAEISDDANLLDNYLKKCQDISKQLNNFDHHAKK